MRFQNPVTSVTAKITNQASTTSLKNNACQIASTSQTAAGTYHLIPAGNVGPTNALQVQDFSVSITGATAQTTVTIQRSDGVVIAGPYGAAGAAGNPRDFGIASSFSGVPLPLGLGVDVVITGASPGTVSVHLTYCIRYGSSGLTVPTGNLGFDNTAPSAPHSSSTVGPFTAPSGALLIVSGYVTANTSVVVSDTLGGLTWTVTFGQTVTTPLGTVRPYFAYAILPANASGSVTATFGVSCGYCTLVTQWLGANLSAPVRQVAFASDNTDLGVAVTATLPSAPLASSGTMAAGAVESGVNGAPRPAFTATNVPASIVDSVGRCGAVASTPPANVARSVTMTPPDGARDSSTLILAEIAAA